MRIDIAAAIERTRHGDLLILVDNPGRENEGDFFIAGEKIDPATVNTMATLGRGLICCPISAAVATRLDLPPQAQHNTALHGTNFTVSIDAADGVTTGISAFDRAHTIRLLAEPTAQPAQFARPGHIFPIVAAGGGLGVRQGQTEGAIALLELAGLQPIGVICEIMDDNGQMARDAQLNKIARLLNIGIVHVDDLVHFLDKQKNRK